MWHVTCDTCDVKGDMCQVDGTFSQNVKSHTVWEGMCFENIWPKGSPTLLILHKGVCRISLATPGLLNKIQIKIYH